MNNENISQVNKSNLVDVVDTQTVTNVALNSTYKVGRAASNLINPNEIAKNYISIAKTTESRLINKADKEINKLDKLVDIDMSNNSSIAMNDSMSADLVGVKNKSADINRKIEIGKMATDNSVKKQANKTSKAIQKRDTYVSKNYRKQTIKKELMVRTTSKIKEKVQQKTNVNSDFLCIKNEFGKSAGSDLLCITNKGNNIAKDTLIATSNFFSPAVKSAKLVSKGAGRMARGGASFVRKLKIKEILTAENMGVEVAKTGIMAAIDIGLNIVSMIFKTIGKWLIKLLMPFVPYLVLVFVPLIIVLVGGVAAALNDNKEEQATTTEEEELSYIGGDVRHRVMERAKTYIGQNGNKIFEYYGMTNHWCCMFVWSCFDMEGAGEIFFNGGKTAYCPDVTAWALNNPECIVYYRNNLTGEIIGDSSAGRYGDIALYDYAPYNNNSDHILLIESYNEETTYYTTVEGNTGGVGNDYSFYTTSKVNLYTTNVSSNSRKLHAIIRPNYNAIEEIR